MKVARIWKKPPSAFLFPGWLMLVIGGTVAVLMVFLMVALPWDDSPYVSTEDLPAHPADAAQGHNRIDLFANGETSTYGWREGRPVRLHIHADATWLGIRGELERLRDDGVKTVGIVVRRDDGTTSALPLPLGGEWPELGVNASAQEFVDAIR